MRRLAVATALLALLALAPARQPKTVKSKATITPPDAAMLAKIQDKTKQLQTQIDALKAKGVPDHALVEVEVYAKAADWLVRHRDFLQNDIGPATLAELDRGIQRAGQAGETPAWRKTRGSWSLRAYRSKLDGSVQPYAVLLPSEYGKDPKKAWRLDVVLHGRDASLTEVKFLKSHRGDKPSVDQDFIELEVYGRGNNAYRWAGEADVLEAISSFVDNEERAGRGSCLDPRRVVLRGFSMGGAGTWHLGLHYPGRWAAMGPGAGFSTTHGYVKGLPDPLPAPQEQLLRIYDAVAYAENAATVPVIAYAGSNDPQQAATRSIEERLKSTGTSIKFIVGEGLEHKMPPEYMKKAEAEYSKYATKGRERYPERVRFVTYTTKYHQCGWADVMGLEKHYERAAVDLSRTDRGFEGTTTNVRKLRLALPSGTTTPQQLTLDAQTFTVVPKLEEGQPVLELERAGKKWTGAEPQSGIEKRPGVQGPIDDAFTGPFLVVAPSGAGWNSKTDAYHKADQARLVSEWDKYYRGKLTVKTDKDVTPDDVKTRHLILFGDPSNNRVLRELLPSLPFQWTRESVQMAGFKYDAKTHVPALIYPNPNSPDRYIVVNSGTSYHKDEFTGSNALLYPRLGDYAIFEVGSDAPLAGKVVLNGLFNEKWK